jgi:ABC-type amino acid transport substrate-binding protein
LAFWSNHSSSVSIRDDHYNISSYALYTFDATWTLILALNKSIDFPQFQSESYCFNASLQNNDEYHKHLNATKFSGVSGPVEFSDNMSNDRVYGALFVLENLQILNGDLNFKRVMKWFQSDESKWVNWANLVKFPLVWPNGRKKPPGDTPVLNGEETLFRNNYLLSINLGQTIKIRVIESPPFVKIINRSSLPSLPLSQTRLPTNDASLLIEGYVADLIALLRKKMNFTPVIDIASSETAYDQLVDSVLPDNNSYSWDIIISDITITSKRLTNVSFSQTILENNVRIAIRDNHSFQFDFFLFVKPFSWQVWLGILCMIIYSGLLLYIFERGTRNEEHFHAQSISIGVFQAITRLVGMSGDITPTTTSSRILSIGLGALCIILVATYTANFCSVLTLERSQPVISGIDDIKKGRFEFDRIGIVVNSAIEDYYKDDVSLSYYRLQSPQDIYAHLLNEQIDAALWDSATLEYQIYENYCKKLTVVGFPFAKSAFGIAMKPDWLYKTNFDVSIVELREEKELENLENKWFKKNSCSRPLNDIDGDISSNSLSIEVMAGLFICFFGLSLITLVIHFWYTRMKILSNIQMIWNKVINRHSTNCERTLEK